MIIYIKMDVALNNLQRLICHKTKPNQTKPIKNIFIILLLFIIMLEQSLISQNSSIFLTLTHMFFFKYVWGYVGIDRLEFQYIFH